MFRLAKDFSCFFKICMYIMSASRSNDAVEGERDYPPGFWSFYFSTFLLFYFSTFLLFYFSTFRKVGRQGQCSKRFLIERTAE
jgi:hypothetical protein